MTGLHSLSQSCLKSLQTKLKLELPLGTLLLGVTTWECYHLGVTTWELPLRRFQLGVTISFLLYFGSLTALFDKHNYSYVRSNFCMCIESSIHICTRSIFFPAIFVERC